MNHEVPSSTSALATRSKLAKKPIMSCADTHGQLGTHMLGVRVTWMQFTGFRAFTRLVERLIPISPGSLASSATATRIYSGIVVAWHTRSILSWLCFSTRLYSRIQRGWANIIVLFIS